MYDQLCLDDFVMVFLLLVWQIAGMNFLYAAIYSWFALHFLLQNFVIIPLLV